jgi:hypothetical protein
MAASSIALKAWLVGEGLSRGGHHVLSYFRMESRVVYSPGRCGKPMRKLVDISYDLTVDDPLGIGS